MQYIPKSTIDGAYSYETYRDMVTKLFLAGKTTGEQQSPALLEYAGLNEQRMNRIEKTFRLDAGAADLLRQIDKPVTWLVITEGWCGDASQILPAIQGLVLQNENIKLKIILRDEHPGIMDAFLTDGSRSIPMVIFVDPSTNAVLGSWGPRPEAPQKMMLDFKNAMLAASNPEEKAAVYENAKTTIHTWYARDKTISTQQELLQAALNGII